MDQRWAETSFYLSSLRQEYLTICEELMITSNSQRQTQLREWASKCLHEFRYMLDQYEEHQRDQYPTTQDTDE